MAEERRQTHDQPAAKVIRELTKLARNLGELSVARRDAVAIALGLGWWMRCIRSAGAVRLLYKSGLSHEASPTVRALLLHAAAIEWLRQYPDEVVEAVRYEHEDYRQKLYQKASDRQWDLSRITLGPPPAGQRPEGPVVLT